MARGSTDRRRRSCALVELREAETIYRFNWHPPGPYDLLHVELAAGGGIVSCNGPTCAQCSKHIVEVGFVGRVWLYVKRPVFDPIGKGWWIAYPVDEFHRLSLLANGATP